MSDISNDGGDESADIKNTDGTFCCIVLAATTRTRKEEQPPGPQALTTPGSTLRARPPSFSLQARGPGDMPGCLAFADRREWSAAKAPALSCSTSARGDSLKARAPTLAVLAVPLEPKSHPLSL